MSTRIRTRYVPRVAPAAFVCLLLLTGSARAEGPLATVYYPQDDVVEDVIPENEYTAGAAGHDDAGGWLADTQAGGCDACCSCCEPKWGARAGALVLFRESPDSAVLFLEQSSPANSLSAEDFDFGYKAGYDVSLMRRFDNLPDIELRYLGSDAWTARAGLVTASTVELGTRIPVTAPDAREIETVIGSKLDSAEINARFGRCGGRIVWLVGFRYLELDEVLDASLVDPTAANPTVLYDIATRNRLYGGQVGAEVKVLERQRLRLDFVGKVGVFGNVNAQDTLLDDTVVVMPAVGNATSTPIVGEAHVTAVVCLYGDLSFRASYGVIGISDVALAGDQMGVTDFLGTNAVHDNGNAFYHGGFVGLGWGY